MNFDEYAGLAERTLPVDQGGVPSLTMVALGLAGEAGEFADRVKKYLYQGHELSLSALADELGDVLWYLAAGAAAVGLEFSEIAARNIAKLEARYPDGFTSEASRERTA
jgi:NTP pyrophosphatase (non-canonical NTP hydrolase)